MEYPRFENFAEDEGPLEGEKKRIDDITGKEILITAYKISKSKFKEGNYIAIQYISNDKKYVVFTGSIVLTNQLEKYRSNLPFYTKIERRKNYYTLT